MIKNIFLFCIKLIDLLIKSAILFFIIITILIISIDTYIYYKTSDKIIKNLEDLPYNQYSIVLGTTKRSLGGINPFYQNRINKAYEIISNNKTEYLILSGDNRDFRYNEPKHMNNDLKNLGVDEKYLILDRYGIRTIYSIENLKNFLPQGIKDITIITQSFHCARAIYTADHFGYNAVCFEARTPRGYKKVRIREYIARSINFFELIFDTKVMFLPKL